MKFQLILLIACCVYLQQTSAKTDKVFCYYGSWATYRNGNGKFEVENIDPNLCTHVIYTFVGLKPDGSINILDPYNDLVEDWGKGGYKRLNDLRLKNPNLKTLIAIGGWNEGSETYSRVAASDSLRAKFVQNAVEFVRKYDFNGFDLDWEYPNQRGGAYADIENFVKLTKELKAAFEPHGYLLTAAVAAAESSVALSYNVPEISKYLDYINVMSYDLHGPWDQVTGHNAPLYASDRDVTVTQKQLNVVACMEQWMRNGAPAEKLIMGMPTYGRTYTLDSLSDTRVGASARNPGKQGPYTQQGGMLGYNEVMEWKRQGGWTELWDDEQSVPYMINGNQWVSYDDEKSIRLKMEYAVSRGFGGGMIWSVETDDFLHGYPILRAINAVIGNKPPVDPPTTPATTTTSGSSNSTTPENPETTTPSNPGEFRCQVVGFKADPNDCNIYYYCQDDTKGGFIRHTFRCPPKLGFNEQYNYCDYREHLKC